MKTLFVSILAFALFFASFATIHAQTTTTLGPAVAFVKADRSKLYIQTLDTEAVQTYAIDSIFNAYTDGAVTIDSIRQLAVIGMTPDGAHLIIAANYYYLNPSNSGHVLYEGLLSIPWPITSFTLTNSVIQLLSTPSILGNLFRPEGVLSADGKQYWITFTTTTGGNDSLTFYHGNTNGTGTIDSTTMYEMQEGFQISNIAIDRANNFMLATTYDGVLDADQPSDSHFLLHAWQAGNGEESAIDLTGAYNNLASNIGLYQQYDSMFGLTVIPQNDGHNALLGLTSDQNMDNGINFYTDPYGSAGGSLSSSNESSMSLPRSIIPDSEDFFSGQSCAPNYEEQPASADKGQMGEGGDISVNAIGGDSVLFVTHESREDCANRDKYASIYFYDYTSGAQNATLVYNDPAGKQPLQPVWVVAPYTTTTQAATNYPGIAWQTSSSPFNFGSVDTGSISSPATFTFVDTSAETAVSLDSATITGSNASEFSIVSGKISGTLQPQKNQSIIVTFTPVAPAGAVSATLNVYFRGQNVKGPTESSITQALSGTVVTPVNGVQQDAMLASSLSIDPNPFTTNASIQLTSPEAGAMSIVVHDALGRTVYTSDLRETGAGQTESFDFDAQSLGLPGGVYYVTAFLGERQASRAVVFVR